MEEEQLKEHLKQELRWNLVCIDFTYILIFVRNHTTASINTVESKFFQETKIQNGCQLQKARDSPEIMQFPNFELLCDSKLWE